MDHQDHVALLRQGVPGPGGVWADLGAGDGAFTLALAELIGSAGPQATGPTGTVYAVDRDADRLRRLRENMAHRFPAVTLHTLTGDFTHPLALPPLDGVVMANSLHFVRDKGPVLAQVRAILKPGGRLLVVEYNTDHGNTWVPYPVSYGVWVKLSAAAGFVHTERIATQPSRFLGEFFAALSLTPTAASESSP